MANKRIPIGLFAHRKLHVRSELLYVHVCICLFVYVRVCVCVSACVIVCTRVYMCKCVAAFLTEAGLLYVPMLNKDRICV